MSFSCAISAIDVGRSGTGPVRKVRTCPEHVALRLRQAGSTYLRWTPHHPLLDRSFVARLLQPVDLRDFRGLSQAATQDVGARRLV